MTFTFQDATLIMLGSILVGGGIAWGTLKTEIDAMKSELKAHLKATPPICPYHTVLVADIAASKHGLEVLENGHKSD